MQQKNNNISNNCQVKVKINLTDLSLQEEMDIKFFNRLLLLLRLSTWYFNGILISSFFLTFIYIALILHETTNTKLTNVSKKSSNNHWRQ